MEFKLPTNAQEVMEVFYQGLIPWGEVPALLMQFITAANVDSVIGSLPTELNDYFVEHARVNYEDDRPGVVISPGGAMPPRPSPAALLAVRGWLARHR